MDQYLHHEFLGQELYSFGLAFLIILVSLVLRRIFDKLISKKLRQWAAKT